MKNFNIQYKQYGSSAILIEWDSKIDESILKDCIAFKNAIQLPNIEDIIQAYNSLTLIFTQPILNVDVLIEKLKSQYEKRETQKFLNRKLWRIPVCYNLIFGTDLKDLAQAKNKSVQEIIHLHTVTEYLIYFIGFQPGFLYLGGLDKELHQPRKATPKHLQKGSVAIGGKQTGIYPEDSLGGWHVIGKTPIPFFDVKQCPPAFVKPLDKIQFYIISLDEFLAIENEVENENFIPEFIDI